MKMTFSKTATFASLLFPLHELNQLIYSMDLKEQFDIWGSVCLICTSVHRKRCGFTGRYLRAHILVRREILVSWQPHGDSKTPGSYSTSFLDLYFYTEQTSSSI